MQPYERPRLSATGKTLRNFVANLTMPGSADGGDSFRIRGVLDLSEWQKVIDLRWAILRAPWGQPRGSEQDPDDPIAVHRIAVTDAGVVVGTGRLDVTTDGQGRVRFMAVLEGWRGRGVGSAILRGLEMEAASMGLRRLELQARAAAVKFYARHGYRAIGPGKVLFGTIQHTIMVKDLD